jgi:branched-chain amino acid transport system ATP-binding protein
MSTNDPLRPTMAPTARLALGSTLTPPSSPASLRSAPSPASGRGAGGEGSGEGQPLLEARGVTKRFGGLVAVSNVDFTLPERRIYSIIGPNGAGKTTFFNIIAGLYRPDAGTITFAGRTIVGLKPHQITRLGIARTFQNIRLFGAMTALENVLVGMHCRLTTNALGAIVRWPAVNREEAWAREEARALLRFVGLAHKEHEWARNLSYGDQRRLEIARALATRPRLLLLDEPTAGMNPMETAATMRFIERLRDTGLTILLIEHDMKVVMSISDRIMVLDHGERIAEGTPAEIRSNPRVIEAYLGRTSGRAATGSDTP